MSVRLRASIAVGVLLLLGLLATYGTQHVLFREDRERVRQRLEIVRKEVRALEVVAAKGDEMVRVLTDLRWKVAVLDEMLPPSMGLAELRQGYEALCREHGLSVVSWEPQQERVDEVRRVEITMELGGSAENVAALRARTLRMTRLLRWDDPAGDGRVVRLTAFSLPPPPARLKTDCAIRGSQTWLWPYTTWLRAQEDELSAACAELSALSAAKAQADEHFALKYRLERSAAAIERLRAEVPPVR